MDKKANVIPIEINPATKRTNGIFQNYWALQCYKQQLKGLLLE